MKIGIFLPNWLGDVVMATPTLRAIRCRFGNNSRIVGIMRPYLGDVLQGTDWLDEQWYFNPRSPKSELRRWALIQKMRREAFDLIILLTNSLQSGLLAWLGSAKRRVGYARDCRGPFLTDKLYIDRIDGEVIEIPMVDYYLKLAEKIGCPTESQQLELVTLDKDEHSADQIWRNLGLRPDCRVVTFNSGSSNGAARFWPIKHFAELARNVVERLDHDVLVMCGPNEQDIAQQIVAASKRDRVFSMANQPLDFGTSKACIKRSRAMVSTDSGPRHLAAAFGKPVITLRGPTLPVWSDNPTVQAIDLRLDLDCIACRKKICPLGHHRCMQEIKPEVVYAELAKILSGDNSAAA